MADIRRTTLPKADRGDDAVAGHWLLARMGKRVLRPGVWSSPASCWIAPR